MKSNSGGEIWRNQLKEHRGKYFVEYQPADSRFGSARLQLVFHEGNPDETEMRNLMLAEARNWSTRFPVPVIVSSFDKTGSFIDNPKNPGDLMLSAFLEPDTDNFVSQWGISANDYFPPELLTEQHLGKVYSEIPFRDANTARLEIDEEWKQRRKGANILKAIFIFWVALPLLLELLSLGVAWLSWTLLLISFVGGCYRIARAAGLIKETKRQAAKRRKQEKMDHYYIHCERNPEGFSRLKNENLEKDHLDHYRKEAEEINRRKN